jgi:UDP-N-acetylglucosamine:LPS N-acetylglucosamine transferase
MRIARRLEGSRVRMQLIVLCGRDERALEEIRNSRFRIPVHADGFTRRIPHYMGLSDFYIGKPGPGLISEAIQMRTPVIVEYNWKTSTQERYPAQFVLDHDIGMTVRNFRDISGTVEQLLRPDNYERFRNNMAGMKNRAVFEVPELLLKILTGTPLN